MFLGFDEHRFSTSVGERVALVITPKRPVTVPLDALPPPGATPQMSEVDAEILDQAKRRAPRVTLCIFRGRDDSKDNHWRFDPDLSEDEAFELALGLMRGQLIVYREMVRTGVCLFLHVGWGSMEAAGFRRACETLGNELEERQANGSPEQQRPTDAVDLWVARNLVFFFSLGFKKVVEDILPEKLALMEKRMDRIQRMADILPPV